MRFTRNLRQISKRASEGSTLFADIARHVGIRRLRRRRMHKMIDDVAALDRSCEGISIAEIAGAKVYARHRVRERKNDG